MASYRGQSPVFGSTDLPIPALRRVKPLPKRRRTMDGREEAIQQLHLSDTLASMPVSGQDTVPVVPDAAPVAVSADANIHLPAMPPLPLSNMTSMTMSTPLGSADDILSHASSLSAQMALQQYYLPILGGMQELFRTELGADGLLLDPTDLGLASFNLADLHLPESLQASLMSSFSPSLSAYQDQPVGSTSSILRREDALRPNGDYADHLQQTGKTKKRKVPVNAAALSRTGDAIESPNGERGEDLLRDNDLSTLPMGEYDFISSSAWGSMSTLNRRRRIPRATLAGLQHKEMLKNRKRQLAAVLGVLAHGDTFALDQAILTSYSSPNATGASKGLKNFFPMNVRLSRRQGPRSSRIFQASRKFPPASDSVPSSHVAIFPQSDFTFTFPSPTSDRLITTKEEVAALRLRFEAEIARQASSTRKTASLDKFSAPNTLSPANKPRAKRAVRDQNNALGSDQADVSPEPSGLPGMKSRGSKKKKRSALANASNPHHLKNYVPSRLPHSNPPLNHSLAANYLSPPPLRFLTTEPRRKKMSASTLSNPEEEWICPFCEYDLFYGEELNLRRALRARKKILQRRRRAINRARSGPQANSTPKIPDNTNEDYDGSEDERKPLPAVEASGDSKARKERHSGGGIHGGGTQYTPG